MIGFVVAELILLPCIRIPDPLASGLLQIPNYLLHLPFDSLGPPAYVQVLRVFHERTKRKKFHKGYICFEQE